MASENILIVDNENHILMSLKIIFRGNDYGVMLAKNGKEAYQKILECRRKNIPVDLLFTDFRMPELNGLELIDRLNEENFSIPVICMTAYGDKDLVTELKRRGCLDCLDKPFLPEEALKKVENALHRHQVLSEYGWIIQDMI